MKPLSVKLGVILIGFAIFGYAEVCRAECAWVLWLIDTDNQIQVLNAFPSYEQCKQAQQISCERQSKAIKDTEIVANCPDSFDFRYKKKGVSTMRRRLFKCLPDTIDPRK